MDIPLTTPSTQAGEPKEPQKGFVARLSERGYERKRATRGVNRGRYQLARYWAPRRWRSA
jgi:hypothetical protein